MRIQGNPLSGEGFGQRGRGLTSEAQSGQFRPDRLLVVAFAAVLVFTLVLVALSFPFGIYTVFFTTLSQTYAASTPISGIYIFLGPLLAIVPVPGTIGAFFVALSVVYALMFLYAARQGRGLVSALKGAYSEGLDSLFSNTLLATVVALGFLTFTVLAIDTLETAGGVPVGGLSGDAMNLFVSLAIAPLREEFGFRLLIIGLIAAFASIGRPWRSALKAIWRPSVAYEDVENNTVTKAALGAALAASALAFGIVHVTSNSGWAIGKLPEAAYAGVVLGYVYIRYGFHAAVLVHWGVDYLGGVFSFFGQGVYGIPWTSNTGYILQQVVTVDLVGVLGVSSFLVVAYMGMRWIARRREQSSSLSVEV